jgi:hypothetical protein
MYVLAGEERITVTNAAAGGGNSQRPGGPSSRGGLDRRQLTRAQANDDLGPRRRLVVARREDLLQHPTQHVSLPPGRHPLALQLRT